MKANNQPAIEPLGEGSPSPTWESLWVHLKPHASSVAMALEKEFGEVSWEDALKVTVVASKDPASNMTAQRRRLGTFADSPSPLYFLTVLEGKVQVVYGWRACRALDADGKIWTALVGDRRFTANGAEVLPKLYRAGTSVDGQYSIFAKESAGAPSMAAIQEAFAEDDAGDLIEPEDSDETVTAWKVLPVHPKVASVFMHSPEVKKAIDLFVKLYQLVPEGEKAGLDPLAEFLRMSVVSKDDDSVMEADWRRVTLHDNEDVELWHAEACGAYAPKYSEAVPPPDRLRPELPTEGVRELMSKIGATAQSKEPGKRAYTPAELKRLAAVCGIPCTADADLTAELLPPFWQGFEAVRGKLHSARAYVEAYLEAHWPADAPRHQRFVSTRLLKDLVALDFDGSDNFITWGEREGGFSIFSIYPLPDGSDPSARRRRAVAFEDTMDNHRPGDRQSMVEATHFEGALPVGRTPTRDWVRHVKEATEVLFGDRCPALPWLDRYVLYLNEGLRFRNFTEREWRVLFWKLHVALRLFFRPTCRLGLPAIQELSDFLMIIRTGLQPNPADLPVELFHGTGGGRTAEPHQVGNGGLVETGLEAERTSGGGPTDAGSLAKKVAKEWQRLLARPLKDAKEAYVNAGKQWGMKVVFPNGAKEAMGNFARQVRPTASGGTTPCPRLFVYGKCASRRCNCSHNLQREPTSAETRAYVDWVQARCSEIKSNPGNF